jgi:hypothetical protein
LRHYNKDGVVPFPPRDPTFSSQFRGVIWVKGRGNWEAQCKRMSLGRHATEEAAARAYNIEAERLGLPLNVIPPAGDAVDDGSNTAAAAATLSVPIPPAPARAHTGAGAGSKRGASASPAVQAKTMRLDTSAGAPGAPGAVVKVGGAAGVRAAAAAAAQGRALQARINVSTSKAEVARLHAKAADLHAQAAEVNTAVAEAQLVVHAAEQEAAEAQRTAARAASHGTSLNETYTDR